MSWHRKVLGDWEEDASSLQCQAEGSHGTGQGMGDLQTYLERGLGCGGLRCEQQFHPDSADSQARRGCGVLVPALMGPSLKAAGGPLWGTAGAVEGVPLLEEEAGLTGLRVGIFPFSCEIKTQHDMSQVTG